MINTSIYVHRKEIQVSLDKNFDFSIIEKDNKFTFLYPCNDSNDCTPYYIRLPAGSYIFEVWGAQGGKGGFVNNSDGGLGGYAKGAIRLRQDTDAYLQVGNKGGPGASGGYNGGGDAKEGRYTGGSGGGASDIRLLQDTFGNRVIVAGGGGGTDHNSIRTVYSWGGGLEGGLSFKNKLLDNQGKQTAGGINGGEFGIGGSAPNHDSGGGGGGWYGGGYGFNESDGGGGSGFVFTEFPKITDPFNLDLKYTLSNTVLLPGNESFYRPNSDGKGAIAITFISFYSRMQTKEIFLPQFPFTYIFLTYKR